MIKSGRTKEKLILSSLLSIVWVLFIYNIASMNISLFNIIPIIISVVLVSSVVAFSWNDYFKRQVD